MIKFLFETVLIKVIFETEILKGKWFIIYEFNRFYPEGDLTK